MNQKIIFLILSFYFLVGCTTIEVTIPTARVYNPEIPAKQAAILDIHSNLAGDYLLAESAGARPPQYNEKVDFSRSTAGMMDFGMQDWLSLGLGMSTPLSYFGKAQIEVWGPKRFDASTGSSLSVFADLSLGIDTHSGDQKIDFGPGGFPWSATGRMIGINTGTSLGYRFNPSLMMYIGYAYQSTYSDLKIKQDPTSDNSDLGGSYETKHSGRSSTSTIGLDIIGKTFIFNPTFDYSEIHWMSQSLNDAKLGGSLVFWIR